MENKEVIIRIDSGIVSLVKIPDDITVTVRDYDIQDYDGKTERDLDYNEFISYHLTY